jgi:hypothetical protein
MAWGGVEEVHPNLYRAVERRRGAMGGELHDERARPAVCVLCGCCVR